MGIPSALWGNATCFDGSVISYEFCCLAGLQLFHSSSAVCTFQCEVQSCFRSTSYEACCKQPLRLRRLHRCFKGCTRNARWAEFVRVFKLARGCIHCVSRLDMLDLAREVIGSGRGCIAGEVLAAFTVLIASAVSGASSIPLRLSAPQAASLVLEHISSCGLSSQDWWHFASITDRQMLYVLAQMEPVPFLGSSYLPSTKQNWQNFTAIDVGAGAFGDTLYFLSSFQHVLAIDARAAIKQPWMRRLGRRLKSFVRAVTKTSGEEVPIFLDQYGQGLMSSLNASLVPGVHLHPLKQTMVSTISCADLYANYSNVLYMKVDVEGFDIDCIRSLTQIPPEKLPLFFCIELPSSESEVLEMLRLLGTLGYENFKISRERLYNLRIARSERYAASGPWGEEAVDFLRGPQWRRASEITPAVLGLVSWERMRFLDWFDLHAARV